MIRLPEKFQGGFSFSITLTHGIVKIQIDLEMEEIEWLRRMNGSKRVHCPS